MYSADAPASEALFDRARAIAPGGVNSPVRAFRAVGGAPRFMIAGSGPLLYDADGREYVDLVCSWGPMILGHAHPAVVQAVSYAAAITAMPASAAGSVWRLVGVGGRKPRRSHRPAKARIAPPPSACVRRPLPRPVDPNPHCHPSSG